MKKAVWVLLLLCAHGGVFALSGVLREKSGVVEIKPPGAVSFVPAKAGEPLTQDTVISTGFRSFAVIEIGHTSITVRPLTCLTLTEIQAAEEEETLAVNLQAGRVRVDVKPPAGKKTSMSVSSPSATASVRGTSFEFDTRNLYVDSGKVSFMGNRGQSILVGAGGNSRVESNAKVTSPIEVKTSGLLPASPVGTEIAVGIPGGPYRVGVPFTIGLIFSRE